MKKIMQSYFDFKKFKILKRLKKEFYVLISESLFLLLESSILLNHGVFKYKPIQFLLHALCL